MLRVVARTAEDAPVSQVSVVKELDEKVYPRIERVEGSVSDFVTVINRWFGEIRTDQKSLLATVADLVSKVGAITTAPSSEETAKLIHEKDAEIQRLTDRLTKAPAASSVDVEKLEENINRLKNAVSAANEQAKTAATRLEELEVEKEAWTEEKKRLEPEVAEMFTATEVNQIVRSALAEAEVNPDEWTDKSGEVLRTRLKPAEAPVYEFSKDGADDILDLGSAGEKPAESDMKEIIAGLPEPDEK